MKKLLPDDLQYSLDEVVPMNAENKAKLRKYWNSWQEYKKADDNQVTGAMLIAKDSIPKDIQVLFQKWQQMNKWIPADIWLSDKFVDAYPLLLRVNQLIRSSADSDLISLILMNASIDQYPKLKAQLQKLQRVMEKVPSLTEHSLPNSARECVKSIMNQRSVKGIPEVVRYVEQELSRRAVTVNEKQYNELLPLMKDVFHINCVDQDELVNHLEKLPREKRDEICTFLCHLQQGAVAGALNHFTQLSGLTLMTLPNDTRTDSTFTGHYDADSKINRIEIVQASSLFSDDIHIPVILKTVVEGTKTTVSCQLDTIDLFQKSKEPSFERGLI